MKTIIIGAGLGGLSAAIYLANKGFEVEVFESQDFPGGKVGQIEKAGFRFDTGPSLLTMPFVLEEVFKDSGYRLQDFMEIKKLDILTKYFYPDGTIIDAYSDANLFADEIQKKTLDSKDSVLRFLEYSKQIYDATQDVFIFDSVEKFTNPFNLSNLRLLPRLVKIDSGRNMDTSIRSFFKDEKTIQLFDRFATYNGSNPFHAPATLNVISHVEHGLGAFYPSRGIYEIPDALFRLAEKKGVKFNFNTKVERILLQDKKVIGVKVDGKDLYSDIVISNADVNFTYSKLLQDNSSKTAKKYLNQELSSSVIVFNWGVKGIHKNLDIHNILFSSDYKKEFDELFNQKKVPSDPTIYINITSKYNLKDAPKGHENWFVLVNSPIVSSDQNYSEQLLNIKSSILNKIKSMLQIDLKNQIVFEDILTPELIEKRTSSWKGALYGISSNNKFAAFNRHPAKSKEYENLYFCGGSAHPGGGIPLVIQSGKLAADRISEDFDRD